MATSIGYLHLAQRFALNTLPLKTQSTVARGTPRVEVVRDTEYRAYSAAYHPGDEPQDHLEFALKHEPLNLEVLCAWFDDHREAAEQAVVALVKRKPTGEYARRAWFLYEWLTERRLDLPDGRPRRFVSLLDDSQHVTWSRQQRGGSIAFKAMRSSRHHVENNLPGTRGLCPLVRRTPEVQRWLAQDFGGRLTATMRDFDPALFRRATSYLYLKETRASFEIEGEALPEAKAERFVALLEQVSAADQLDHDALVRWQRELVEPRFRAESYRTDQVYIGESGRIGRLGKIHFIPPKPDDVPAFMEDLLVIDALHDGVPPLIHAAVIAFAFVLIHPFDDGNGRLHRLLIHNVLRRRGLSPPGIVVPVSAVMLDDRAGYDAVLESFSKPLMQLLDYERDEDDRVTVHGSTARHYRYFDATPMVEGLGRWIDRTLEEDFPDELRWLEAHDRARAAMKRIVDLPEKHARTLIQVLLNNNGKMSHSKRARFDMLSDDELERISRVVREELLPYARSR